MAKAKVRATCDKCGSVFLVKMRERASPQGGVVIYFDCPRADRFDVAYLPARAVVVREELEGLRERWRKSRSDDLLRDIEAHEREFKSLYVGLSGRGG